MRFTRLLPWVVAAGCALLVLAIMLSAPPVSRDRVAFGDFASEGLYLVMVLVWLTITARLDLKARIAVPLLGGFALLAFGAVEDMLDELFTTGRWLALENVGIPAGTLLVGIGLYFWGREHQWAMLRLRQEKDVFQSWSQRDELTRLFNRRHFDTALSGLLSAAKSSGHLLALAIADIDDFKRYNDTLGHPAGDRVLQAAGEALKRAVRKADQCFRIGGEEFAVILPDCSPQSAAEIGERIRRAFEMLPVPTAGAQRRPTVSVGIAFLRLADNVHTLLKRADDAMYRAKKAGKNRVEIEL
ncbi:MAG TPA: GGDEF domain-containing protein [Burkholderiales bacterium]|jgi:diguanylate cyclase (GGDEF)-like protein|nr:GGDEF domain-containing protein [Burkholderiales bacterium]